MVIGRLAHWRQMLGIGAAVGSAPRLGADTGDQAVCERFRRQSSGIHLGSSGSGPSFLEQRSGHSARLVPAPFWSQAAVTSRPEDPENSVPEAVVSHARGRNHVPRVGGMGLIA